MAETQEVPFKFDVGTGGSPLSFELWEDLEAWYKNEKNQWSWLPAQSASDGATSYIRDNHTRFWQTSETQIQSLKDGWRTAGKAKAVESVRTHFENSFKNNVVIYSQSVNGQFILNLAKRNQRIAVYAFAYLVGQPVISQGIPQSAEGFIEAFAFKKGLSENATAERSALQQLLDEWKKLLDETKSERRSIASQWDGFQKGAETWFTGTKDEYKKTHDNWNEKFSKMYEEHNKTLKGIESSFNERIALEAPVNYWEQRKTAQQKLIKPYFWGLVICSGLLALSIVLEVWGISASSMNDLAKHAPRVVGTIILLTTLVALLRLAQRLFLSALHVGADADERVVMAKTFISLIKENAIKQTEDRSLILQSLFRPGSTGLLSEDNGPPYPQDALVKVFTKDK